MGYIGFCLLKMGIQVIGDTDCGSRNLVSFCDKKTVEWTSKSNKAGQGRWCPTNDSFFTSMTW